MAELTDARIRAALDRGRIAEATEPRARSARYHRGRDRIVVELTNGCSFAFPPRRVEGLETATSADIARVEILGNGYGLRWDAQDIDISMPGLLAGIFGTRAHMARLAGRTTSPAKAAAARANGRKGGRPRKIAS